MSQARTYSTKIKQHRTGLVQIMYSELEFHSLGNNFGQMFLFSTWLIICEAVVFIESWILTSVETARGDIVRPKFSERKKVITRIAQVV